MKMNGRLAAKDEGRLFPGEFYQRFLPIEISGKDLLVAKALADVHCRSSYLENRHLVGAAGQVMVAKALGLSLNGFSFERGDGGIDYKGTRIDTKTVFLPYDKPLLWVPQDPAKRKGPKIYTGVALRSITPYRINGEIFGFATTSLINSMTQEKFVQGKYGKLGISAEFLHPISWLILALNSIQDFKRVMGQFLPPEELEEVYQCLPKSHNEEGRLDLLPFFPIPRERRRKIFGFEYVFFLGLRPGKT